MFNDLTVRLSVLLNDPVSSATANGVVYSASLRAEYINSASVTLWNILYNGIKGQIRKINAKLDRFADFINTTTLTTTSSSTASVSGLKIIEIVQMCIPGTVKFNVINPTDVNAYDVITEPIYATEQSPICYLEYPSRGNIVIKPDVAAFRSKQVRLTYLKYPNTYATGDTVEWNITFHPYLLRLAVAHAMLDDGNPNGYELYYRTVVNELMPGLQEMEEVKK